MQRAQAVVGESAQGKGGRFGGFSSSVSAAGVVVVVVVVVVVKHGACGRRNNKAPMGEGR